MILISRLCYRCVTLTTTGSISKDGDRPNSWFNTLCMLVWFADLTPADWTILIICQIFQFWKRCLITMRRKLEAFCWLVSQPAYWIVCKSIWWFFFTFSCKICGVESTMNGYLKRHTISRITMSRRLELEPLSGRVKAGASIELCEKQSSSWWWEWSKVASGNDFCKIWSFHLPRQTFVGISSGRSTCSLFQLFQHVPFSHHCQGIAP